MKKQIFGILLALCMAAAMVSLQAVAASAAEEKCTCLVKCTADNMNADCPVCSKAGAAVGNCKGRFPFSGEVTVDLQLQNIMNLDQTNQAIYYFPLSDDITIASALTEITVPQGADVVLDLNGHTISRKGDGKIFVVYGKLTIIDSVGTGKLTNATDGALDIRGGGYVLMQGGSIEGNHNATQTVYAVYVNDSTFEMTGGTIKNNRAFGIKNIYAYNSTVIIDGTAQVLCCEEDGCEHNVRKYTDSIVLNARTKLYLDGGNIKGNIFIKEISVTVDSRHAGAGTVVNGYLNVFSGIIKAGTYTGLVKFDDAFIYGGTFLGTVELSKYTRIVGSAKVPVKFVTDAGKVIATVKVLRGQGIAAEDIPTVSDPTTYGYSYFAGWSIGSDQYYAGGGQFVDNVNYVTAKFGNPIKYTLSIDLEGGTASNPTTYTADDTFTLENPTKEGYIFTGWGGTDLKDTNNMAVTIPKGSTGDRTYTAYYLESFVGEPTSPNYFYTVVYDTRGGSPVEPKKVGLGDTSKVEVLDGVSTTRAGYRFSGWYCGSRRIALQDTTVEDLKGYSDNGVITLTARWTEKKTVSFDTAAQDCTYDGTEKAYAITGTTLDGFNVTYRQGGNLVTNPTDAGLYDVIVTRAEDEFYKAVNETVKCGLVIGPKEVTVTIDAIPDEIYTGSEITPSVTVYDGETEIPASEYTVEYADNINAGKATVTLTDNTDGNYTAISGSASFEIKPKAVTATISAIPDETYTGSEIAPTVTVYDGETVIPANEYTVEYTDNINVGRATVTLTDNTDGNYTAISGSATFEIKPKTVTATISAIPDEIYTGGEITPTVTAYDGETEIPASEYTVEYADNINAGTATVTLTDKAGGNYTVGGSTSFEIKPKTVTATISAIPDEIYTGGEIAPTVTAYDGETVIPAGEYTVEYTDNKNVGKAMVTLTDKTGGNYTVGGSASFEIKPKSIEDAVLAPSETLIYNGTEQTQTVTVTLAGFDPVTFTVSGNRQTDVNTSGAYTLTVTANGNFTGTKTLDWNIAPATPVENPAKKTTARVAKNKTLADASVSNGEILALDGTTPLAGTFAWVDSTTVMRTSGTAQMTFTPESTNYAPITIDVAVTAYSSGGGGGGVAAPASYTVRFDSNGGSGIASQTVAENGKVTSPANPTKEGYTFDGWYTDKELTGKYDFAAAVTKDFTLYAKWVKEEWKKPFIDIGEDDWFYADIAYVYESGLMTGTSTTEFSPDATTTRGMVVTILYRLDDSPAVGSSCPFNDIASDAYYKDAAAWAVANGIAGGYGNALFGPNDSITREQLATLLYRYAKYKGLDVSVDDETNILGYNDAQSISEYAFPAMQWLCGKGILQGINGSLMPAETATRAQIAALLHRFCETVMKG